MGPSSRGNDETGQSPAGSGGRAHAHGAEVGHGMITRGAERSRLSLVLVITAVFMVAEVVGGVLSNSLALLADAGHMFTDTAALALALFAMRLAMRPPSPAKTYGYVRLEVLAALVNGAALLVIAIFILREAYQRILSTREVDAPLMLGVAFLGLLVNLVGALLLRGHAGENLNLRGAYLHVLGDLLGSLGTILAGVIILSTGWHPADPVISILIAVLILVSAWRLVREATDVLLEAAPRDVDVENLLSELSTIPGLHDVHDLHVWTLTSGFVALSGHGIIDDPLSQAEILAVIRRSMARRGIEHVTFQLELRPLYQIPDPERGGGLENADE